jgi:hypothetical protein
VVLEPTSGDVRTLMSQLRTHGLGGGAAAALELHADDFELAEVVATGAGEGEEDGLDAALLSDCRLLMTQLRSGGLGSQPASTTEALW